MAFYQSQYGYNPHTDIGSGSMYRPETEAFKERNKHGNEFERYMIPNPFPRPLAKEVKMEPIDWSKGGTLADIDFDKHLEEVLAAGGSPGFPFVVSFDEYARLEKEYEQSRTDSEGN